MWFVVGQFKRHNTLLDSCRLLSPVQGVTARTRLECATQCLEKSAFCEGFTFSSNTRLCKLVGSLGTHSSDCGGEYYVVL